MDNIPPFNSNTAEYSPSADGISQPRFTVSERLVMITNPASLQAESIRALRANLVATHLHDRRRSLAACSPTGGSGCSFVAVNLAVAMAQVGVKTLLIDGNLCSPALGDYFVSDSSPPGLSEALADPSRPLGSVVQQVQPMLSVLFAGAADGQAQELIGGSRFKELIDLCLRDYDLTIVDTPPANQFADARRIASVLRYAAIVACRGRTYLKDVRAQVDELEGDGVKVIGTYLNDY